MPTETSRATPSSPRPSRPSGRPGSRPSRTRPRWTGTSPPAARRCWRSARGLLDTRLTYQAVVEVLRTRDKVIIDAPDVPGRRHLFLLDPDLLKVPQLIAPRTIEKDP